MMRCLGLFLVHRRNGHCQDPRGACCFSLHCVRGLLHPQVAIIFWLCLLMFAQSPASPSLSVGLPWSPRRKSPSVMMVCDLTPAVSPRAPFSFLANDCPSAPWQTMEQCTWRPFALGATLAPQRCMACLCGREPAGWMLDVSCTVQSKATCAPPSALGHLIIAVKCSFPNRQCYQQGIYCQT